MHQPFQHICLLLVQYTVYDIVLALFKVLHYYTVEGFVFIMLLLVTINTAGHVSPQCSYGSLHRRISQIK